MRLYSVDAHGRRGVVFRSMDASRLIPVVMGRVGFRLPYLWSRMSVRTAGDTVTYTSSRRWPGPRGARSRITVRTGEPIGEPTELEHFLTARWGMHNAFFGAPSRWPICPTTIRAGPCTAPNCSPASRTSSPRPACPPRPALRPASCTPPASRSASAARPARRASLRPDTGAVSSRGPGGDLRHTRPRTGRTAAWRPGRCLPCTIESLARGPGPARRAPRRRRRTAGGRRDVFVVHVRGREGGGDLGGAELSPAMRHTRRCVPGHSTRGRSTSPPAPAGTAFLGHSRRDHVREVEPARVLTSVCGRPDP